MVGVHVDIRSRWPVVQRVLYDVDCHARIQSDGFTGIGCTALLVHYDFFIFLVTVRGAIGGYGYTLTGVKRHSDKTQERFWHMSLSYGIGIVGFIISMATTNIAARYVSM